MPAKRDNSKSKNAFAYNSNNGIISKSKRLCSVAMDFAQRHEAFEENAKFCAVIKRHKCIYDGSCVQKKVLDKAWQNIADMCQKTVNNCKHRWRNLRSAYARSIAVYKTNSGPNRIKPYYLHNELKFLNSFIRKEEAIPVNTEREMSKISTTSKRAAANEQERVMKRSESIASVHESIEEAVPMVSVAQRKHSLNTNNNKANRIAKLCKPTPITTTRVVTATASAQSTESSGECADTKFLECVLSEIKSMNKRQKNILKIKICESVHAVLDSAAGYPMSTETHSSGNNNSGSETVVQLFERRITELSKTDLQTLQRVMQQRERELDMCEYDNDHDHTNNVHDGRTQTQQTLQVLPFMVKQESTSEFGDELINDSGVSSPTQ